MNENIINIKYQDKDITLVKTAHISKNSVEDVKRTVEEIKPDSICVELDPDRYDSIIHSDTWRNRDITQVIKDKKVGFLMVNIILASFQKRMAKKMDNTSGQEMIAGINLAKENDLILLLGKGSDKYQAVEDRREYYFEEEEAIKARLEAEYKYYNEFSPQKYLFKEYGVGGV